MFFESFYNNPYQNQCYSKINSYFIHFSRESFIYPVSFYFIMKNPKNMTTEELIELADEIKKGMTESWIERRQAIKHEIKPLLVR